MRIWRYMDLSKFISLLSNEALYFANPTEFDDPYEFHMPRSHSEVFKRNKINWLQKEIKKYNPNVVFNEVSKELENQVYLEYRELEKKVKRQFGVNCWHINDYENDALWKIYTNLGQGIAIESTDEKLKNSVSHHNRIFCGKVRYEDFDIAPIKKGYAHYNGFIKRKAFSYEKEYRAMVSLDEKDWGNGCLIKTDLNILIDKIHISPLMPKYFFESVRYLFKDKFKYLENKIHMSNLYDNLKDR